MKRARTLIAALMLALASIVGLVGGGASPSHAVGPCAGNWNYQITYPVGSSGWSSTTPYPDSTAQYMGTLFDQYRRIGYPSQTVSAHAHQYYDYIRQVRVYWSDGQLNAYNSSGTNDVFTVTYNRAATITQIVVCVAPRII